MPVQLLIHAPAPATDAAATAFGGLPALPADAAAGFAWPTCRDCAGPMTFLGQVLVPGDPADKERSDRLALVFMCGTNPGLCEEWDADAGANRLILVPLGPAGERSGDPLRSIEPPPDAEGVTRREGPRYGARLKEVSGAADYDAARAAWAEAHEGRQREVLGQYRGVPAWLQGDETPRCGDCGRPMRLLAQLEPGPDAATEMNFGGGGCAYLFDCPDDPASGKFLWQS